MLKSVILSPNANQDLIGILDSVYQYTLFPSTPQKLLNEFNQLFERLRVLPKMGKLIENGKRMIFCRHYRIIYQETEEQIIILTIVHSRKRYPA